MHDTLRIPDAKVSLTLAQLAEMQRGAAAHLTFSLTLACPLQCAHCIVDAGPSKGWTTMPLDQAERYASQMADLAARGIRALSFTGGEPILARRQLKVLSDAGHAAGMTCGVVTAAHWARDAAAADETIAYFDGVRVWDISIDEYHGDWVPFESVKRAYESARRLGRTATIRFSYHDPATEGDARVLEYLSSFVAPEDLCAQRIRRVGRGIEVAPETPPKYHPWNKPCVTQGLVVRYDGSVAPCCVNLVEERNHPFAVGDPRVIPLGEVHDHYMALPLLQMLRLIGFTEVMQWLAESHLDVELARPLPDDVCDLCHQLMTNPRIADYLRRRADTPQNRLRIAVLASRLLGEHGMLTRTVRDLAPQAADLEGFDLAAALAHEVTMKEQKHAARQD